MNGNKYQELFTALGRLDRILERATRAADAAHGGQPTNDPYRGPTFPSDDVSRMLAREPGAPLLAGQEAGERQPEFPQLQRLAERFGSERRSTRTWCCWPSAPEVDLRYERLYAYLHDDISRRRPTVDLAMQLLCAERDAKLAARARFAPGAPLLDRRVVALVPDAAYANPPLIAHFLKLEDAVVRFLLGEHSVDARMAAWLERHRPGEETQRALPGVPIDRIEALSREARRNRRPARYYFGGLRQGLKLRTAEALAFRLDMPLIRVSAARMPATSPEFEESLDLAVSGCLDGRRGGVCREPGGSGERSGVARGGVPAARPSRFREC